METESVMMLSLLVLLAFPAMMAFAAASDLLTMTIPNRLTLALCATFPIVALAAGIGPSVVGCHILVAALTLAVGFALFARGWIGGGDAKLAAATALWLGNGTLVDYVLFAGVGGGVLTLVILVLRQVPLPSLGMRLPWFARLQDPQSGVPYGIALAAAALIVFPESAVWQAAVAH